MLTHTSAEVERERTVF
uniref:Uncharacterized protein n=1 Tax=Anguilla anguilla TaxID=7936 RepID=A0A0E9W5K3_ANGAN